MMNGRLNAPERAEYRQRLFILLALVMAVFLVIFGRLIYLQVLKGDEYRQRSENNSVRLRKIRPVRGLIMDTKRRIIADSKPSFDLIYVPQKHGNVLQVLSKVAAVYQRHGITGQFEVPPTSRLQPFVPVRLERNLSLEKVAVIESNLLELQGVTVEPVAIRSYHYGETMGHVIGYIGEVTQDELTQEEWNDCRESVISWGKVGSSVPLTVSPGDEWGGTGGG